MWPTAFVYAVTALCLFGINGWKRYLAFRSAQLHNNKAMGLLHERLAEVHKRLAEAEAATLVNQEAIVKVIAKAGTREAFQAVDTTGVRHRTGKT